MTADDRLTVQRDAWLGTAARLQAELDAAREALRPFADAAKYIVRQADAEDDWDWLNSHWRKVFGPLLMPSAFGRARAEVEGGDRG